jgi:hypothetical protein
MYKLLIFYSIVLEKYVAGRRDEVVEEMRLGFVGSSVHVG